jgi:hypothetical protein
MARIHHPTKLAAERRMTFRHWTKVQLWRFEFAGYLSGYSLFLRTNSPIKLTPPSPGGVFLLFTLSAYPFLAVLR